MIKNPGISKEKFLGYAAIAVALVALIHYFVLHWTLITDPMPLSMREAAPILITEGYVEQLQDGVALPYSVEQYPENISVYGPVYTVLIGILQAGLDIDPYFLHRCFVGLAVFASALLCGLLIAKVSTYQSALLGTVWFYIIQVASTTVVSGPDALALLFYVLGIAAILSFGASRLGLGLAITAGFLGLLTKPYVVLVIPAALTYTYLFHSPRRALIGAGYTVLATLVLFYLSSLLMPTYFHSVFQIHTAYATRNLDHLLSQIFIFGKLNFALIAAFLIALPLSGYFISKRGINSLWGTRPLIGPDIGFDRFLVLVAGVVLLLILGWHGGSFLSYFNQLLLPPLLLFAFCCKTKSGTRNFLIQGILIINLILLVFWRPPLQAENSAHLEAMSLLVGKKALVEPALDPIARLFDSVDLIDNGQTEYLVKYDLHHPGSFSELSADWEDQLLAKIKGGEYAAIVLAPQYSRKPLLDNGVVSQALMDRYEITHVVDLPIYFSHFKDWSMYGKGHIEFYLFQRQDTLTKETEAE